ncbi:Uncharacterised protein [Bordetella pertussis]|nr:Uncharacterised protein [Bordetella pertussis]
MHIRHITAPKAAARPGHAHGEACANCCQMPPTGRHLRHTGRLPRAMRAGAREAGCST